MRETKNDNLMGFKRKLMETMDINQVNEILKLFPKRVVMPLFYKGDIVMTDENEEVKITEVSYKNNQYIYYYFSKEHGEVYSYEDDFIF